MVYTLNDIRRYLECSNKFRLDNEKNLTTKPTFFDYLKDTVIYIYSEELSKGIRTDFRKIISHWDRIFWNDKDVHDPKVREESARGLKILDKFYNYYYLPSEYIVAGVKVEHTYVSPSITNSLELLFIYDVILLDKKEKVHLLYFNEEVNNHNRAAYDPCCKILYWMLIQELKRPVDSITKHSINFQDGEGQLHHAFNRARYTKEDLENVPEILEYITLGLKNNIFIPNYGSKCESCPHYICGY